MLWVEDLESITSAIYIYFVANLSPDFRKILCLVSKSPYKTIQK